jgi:hypothetical protein
MGNYHSKGGITTALPQQQESASLQIQSKKNIAAGEIEQVPSTHLQLSSGRSMGAPPFEW